MPPEAISVLNLGPKFALTPKMQIITEVEKVAPTLERNDKRKEAGELRHQTTNILLRAKTPKSNLTGQQRRGLSFLKNNRELAVVPYDKKQGFVPSKELNSSKRQKRSLETRHWTPRTRRSPTKGKFSLYYANSINKVNSMTRPTNHATHPDLPPLQHQWP
jgi:hypothetical protein